MKDVKNILLLLGLVLLVSHTQGQTVAIPDINFLKVLKTQYPLVINENNELNVGEAAKISALNVSKNSINSLEGIQYFTGLKNLDASHNLLTSIPGLTSLKQLSYLKLEDNKLTSIPSLEAQSKLLYLSVFSNTLKGLPDVSQNINLTEIIASNNLLETFPSILKLTNLSKLDVGNNKLTNLPDFSASVALTELTCWNNELKQLPDLLTCKKLIKLNASWNNLSNVPDISSHFLLQELSLDRNNLSNIPDLSKLTDLKKVELHYNYLTFEDFQPLVNLPYFKNIVIAPQKNIAVKKQNPAFLKPFYLSTKKEKKGDGILYYWYFNGKQILSPILDDSLYIPEFTIANNGYYFAELTYALIPNLKIRTDTIYLTVSETCPDFKSIIITTTTLKCREKATLRVSLKDSKVFNLQYQLTSTTGKIVLSQNGYFENLQEPTYKLVIKGGASCNYIQSDLVVIPVEECEESVITPNNDGEDDFYYFTEVGTVKIYDRSGSIIKTMNIPGVWDATLNDGTTVSPGYYLAKVNDGKELIHISVLY